MNYNNILKNVMHERSRILVGMEYADEVDIPRLTKLNKLRTKLLLRIVERSENGKVD